MYMYVMSILIAIFVSIFIFISILYPYLCLYFMHLCVYLYLHLLQYCFISIDIDPSTFDIYPYLPIFVHNFYVYSISVETDHIDWPFLFTYTFSSIYFSALLSIY